MNASIQCSVFAIITLLPLSTFGQSICHNNIDTPNNNGPGYINDPADPYGVPAVDALGTSRTPAAGITTVDPLNPTRALSPAARPTPAAPAARITVVSANELPSAQTASKIPAAMLTIVADDPVVSTTTRATPAPEPKLDERIAKLVGIWKAVARHSNGELTTVELHLDNRGWAELTVPGNDGKPNTTKSRVDFENDELKLKGDDKVMSLGKLVESTSRQMVLERAEGRVTFVRL